MPKTDYTKRAILRAEREAANEREEAGIELPAPQGDHRFVGTPRLPAGIDDALYDPRHVQNCGPAKMDRRNYGDNPNQRFYRNARDNERRYKSTDLCGNIQGRRGSATKLRVKETIQRRMPSE